MNPRSTSRSAEAVLRAVAEGTAAATGEEFFRALTHHLATALDLRYCLLTECLDFPPTRLSTLAFWNGESFVEEFEYDLAGTPCERVLDGETCVYGGNVQTLFPKDQDLVALEAESYAAVPFRDSGGRVIGHLVVIDVKAFEEDSLDVSILKIFAARAAAELERQRTMAELEAREKELQRYQKQLEERVRERTEELEAFTYTVSHDLRAPLVTIGGFMSLLLRDYQSSLDDRGKGYLSRVGRAVEGMGALIEALLAYSRLVPADMEIEPVAVHEVITEAIEQLAAEISAHRVQLEVGNDPLWVDGFRPTLTQALVNLISNAVKYAGIGDPPNVRVWAEAIGRRVRIYVRDNGIGIAPEHHQRIFRAFERLPEADRHPGTGLGLAIVKKAAERMGGKVGLESAPGAGSTFWIELGRAAGRTDAEE